MRARITILLFCALLLVIAGVGKAEDPVVFPDANLKQAVIDALAALDPPIITTDPTPTDMLSLTSFQAAGRSITSLTGLEHATNLRSLRLSVNQISNISPLTGLTNLQVLHLDRNRVSSISALSGMVNLSGLFLMSNQISDISPLTNITGVLTTLELGANRIGSVNALAGMANLQALGLGGNQISDISPLAGLTNLWNLRLDRNQIRDIFPLLTLTYLMQLDLRSNPLNADACTTYIPAIRASHPGIQLQENSCFEPGENILTNGGFEGGTVSPWTIYANPPAVAQASVVSQLTGATVPEGPVEGSSCLHVTISGASPNWWEAGLSYRGLVFQAGKKYTLSAFLKSKEGMLRINFKPESSQAPWTGYGEQQFEMTDEWAEYSVTTPVFLSTVSPADIMFHIGFAPGEFWMDSVRFYEGDYVPVQTELTFKAREPSPAPGASDVATDAALSWTPGQGATSHHIYLGTSRADVIARTSDTDKGTQTETSYTPGALAYGTMYYWCVDEFDGTTTHPGKIWSFATRGQGEGQILFEYFWGTDYLLQTLLALPTFPDDPDQSEVRTSFEGPTNWRESYGTHARGYLHPPATGDYTFWIASDDQSQLWLSTDENPANAVQIASVPGWTPARDFDNTGGGSGGPQQESSPIPLEAGRRYYIEALCAQGAGGDNLAVAWQGPSIPTRQVISGTFLSAWTEDSDGVPGAVEDGAPNGGDGNTDGIPDSQQDNVVSLPNAADGQYVTLVSPEGTEVQNTVAGANPSPGDAPAGVEFPVGFFDFDLSGMGAGGNATVTILLPPEHAIETYYKYGPTPDNPAAHWYEFLYDGTTGAEILSDRVILHFVDGSRGDDDLSANGLITEPGAPVLRLYPRHSLTASFNGTAIPAGRTIWFNSVITPKGLPGTPVTIQFVSGKIQSADGRISVRVPDAILTFDPAATCAETHFVGGRWVTRAPASGLSGNVWLSGAGLASAGLPGGIKDVTWSGGFICDTPGVTLQWKWAAAVYTSFPGDLGSLGVKSVDGNKDCSYSNSDHAGTPEAFKSYVTGGARGGGGSNYTGGYSGTLAVTPYTEN